MMKATEEKIRAAIPSMAELFFQAAQPQSVLFNLAGVGEVSIVELKEIEVSDIRRRIESEKDPARRSKLFGMGLVVRSVRLENKCIFNEDDIIRFEDAGNSVVEKLAAIVLKINGYGSDTGDAAGN